MGGVLRVQGTETATSGSRMGRKDATASRHGIREGRVEERLTLATATGLPLLSLALHVAAGSVALVAGYSAIAARKGGPWHRRSGTIFVYGMLALGLSAVGISVYEGSEDVSSGALTAYLVFTSWTTVSPLRGAGRRVDLALMALAFVFAAGGFLRGVEALGRPGGHIAGVPAGMLFFLATIVLLAAIGDARMIRAGGIQGTRRLARHLWRMCFALFIAAGSFFSIRSRVAVILPDPLTTWPVRLVPILLPFAVMFYWLWRMRRRRPLPVVTRHDALPLATASK